MKRPYLLKARGLSWYYRPADDPTFHSTGIKCRTDPAKPPRHEAEAIAFCLHDFERNSQSNL